MVEVVIADPSFLTREGFKKTMEGENSYKIVGEINIILVGCIIKILYPPQFLGIMFERIKMF